MSKRSEADKIIKRHVIWALGGGLIPVPVLDFAAVTAIQIDMLSQLTNLYEVDYNTSTGKVFVGALTGTTFAKIGSSFIKIIPGFGTLIGGLSMSILSGASTYAVGQVAVEHFESGGNLLNIDMEAAKKFYKDAFEKGKDVAADLKEEQEAGKSAPKESVDVYEDLAKLGELRDKGVITAEEFEAQKQKLLERI